MNNLFSCGDFISVSGGTIDKSGAFSPTCKVCKVVAVGKHDLLVHDHPKRSFDRMYCVPIEICRPVSVDASAILSASVTRPKIGDLVMSYSPRGFDDSNPVTGILYSITYSDGAPRSCKIICGEDLVDSQYSELIVI